MSKMLNATGSAGVEDAGLSNPGLGQKHAEQALTPGRMTPARYRFDAAVAYNAYHASTNDGRCLEISPAVRCRTSLALMHKHPMGCSNVLSHPEENSAFVSTSLSQNLQNPARKRVVADPERRVTTALRAW